MRYQVAFEEANHVLVTDIYAAREAAIPNVNSAEITKRIAHARHTHSFDDTVRILLEEVHEPAIILIMSAGDATRIGIDYLSRLQDRVL